MAKTPWKLATPENVKALQKGDRALVEVIIDGPNLDGEIRIETPEHEEYPSYVNEANVRQILFGARQFEPGDIVTPVDGGGEIFLVVQKPGEGLELIWLSNFKNVGPTVQEQLQEHYHFVRRLVIR